MEEEFELLQEISGKLDNAKIEYMITGSIAMAFYSTPRMTRDIDIIINISINDRHKIVDLFQNDFQIETI